MRPEELVSSSTTSQVSNSTLAYHLDVLILIIISVFSLFNIPSALFYIANNRSELFQGYFLCSTGQFRIRRSSSGTTLRSTEIEKESLEHSLPTLESAAVPKQPWHFPMHLSFRHPAASFTQYRVVGNYTVVQVLLMAGYAAVIFYVAFYRSNPFSAPKRIGWVIASQIPFVYAFATKNNVIGLLVGVGYEKVRV